MRIKSFLYQALKYSNDVNAVRKGKVGKRIGRRVGGKMAGKAMRGLFK